MVRQFDARQYVALTLYAVRGYVALTQDTEPRQFVTLTAVRGRAVSWRVYLLKYFLLIESH